MAAPNARTGVSSHWPQVVTNIDHTYQYALIVTVAYGLTIVKRNLSDWTETTYNMASIAGNPLGLPIDSVDDHEAWAIGVHRESGGDRIWVAGGTHADPRRAVFSAIDSITSWTAIGTAGPPDTRPYDSAGDDGACTYHLFAHSPDGSLYWFHDLQESSGSSQGRDWLCWKRGPNATSWVNAMGSVELAQTDPQVVPVGDPGREADRVYVCGVNFWQVPDGPLLMYMTLVWRLDDIDAESAVKPCLVLCEVGSESSTMQSMSGAAQTVPIRYDNLATDVEVPVPTAPTIPGNFGMGIAIDGDGNPHFVVQNRPALPTVEYWRLYWNIFTGWNKVIISTPGGSNGPSLHYIPVTDTLYLVTSGSSRIRAQLQSSAVLSDGGSHTTVNPTIYLGNGEVPVGMEVNPDPVLLYDLGILSFCIPDGDTPDFYAFGGNAYSR